VTEALDNRSPHRIFTKTHSYSSSADRRTERRDVHVTEALGGAAEGSCEQETAAVEEDEEMDREDERGCGEYEAARPVQDLNELEAHVLE
jgi:hypothetical protein